MISIGNDIVDLNDFDSDLETYNRRYIQRVLSESEIATFNINLELILEREKIKSLFWRLWAAKEAAYKSLKRINSEYIFKPSEYTVSPDFSEVKYGPERAYCSYEEKKNYIHVICSNKPVQKLFKEKKIHYLIQKCRFNDNHRDIARQKIKADLTEIYQKEINLIFTNRIPSYIVNDNEYPVSISHHGQYVSAAAIIA